MVGDRRLPPKADKLLFFGAAEETRTPTGLTPLRPERSVYTNFTTAAGLRRTLLAFGESSANRPRRNPLSDYDVA